MKGISTTTSAFFVPRATAAPWWIMSSIVTDTVSPRPSMTLPSESPTRMESMPDSSTSRAVV